MLLKENIEKIVFSLIIFSWLVIKIVTNFEDIKQGINDGINDAKLNTKQLSK